MTGKKTSVSVARLVRQIESLGSQEAIRWYAAQTGMPVESAAQAVAYSVFCGYEDGTVPEEGIIDHTLCRAMWRKYITDDVVDEIVDRALAVDKFERLDLIDDCLSALNIPYPSADFIIDAIYNVYPELRYSTSKPARERTADTTSQTARKRRSLLQRLFSRKSRDDSGDSPAPAPSDNEDREDSYPGYYPEYVEQYDDDESPDNEEYLYNYTEEEEDDDQR